jgi:hypothetical protein
VHAVLGVEVTDLDLRDALARGALTPARIDELNHIWPMTAVYDVLSPQLRETLEGMTAHHGVHDLMAAYGTGNLVWTTRHYALALRTTARPARRSVGVEACSAYHTSSPLLCLSGGLLCAMLLQPLL